MPRLPPAGLAPAPPPAPTADGSLHPGPERVSLPGGAEGLWGVGGQGPVRLREALVSRHRGKVASARAVPDEGLEVGDEPSSLCRVPLSRPPQPLRCRGLGGGAPGLSAQRLSVKGRLLVSS